jgi:ABC-2 type transport system permease protein
MIGTIARLTAMSLLRGWRGVLLALLPAALLLLTVVIRGMLGDEGPQVVDVVLGGLTMGTVVPLIALIIGTGAISTEVDDGSIVYLLTKPIPRWKIVLTKFAVAAVTALVFAALPTFAAALILTGVGALAVAYGIAAVIACLVYCALFVLLGVLSRQAVIIGLVYVLLWENLVAGLISGTRVLSVQHWATSVASTVAPGQLIPGVNVVVAAVLAVVTTVGAVWYASRRLRSLTLAGAEG